LKCIWRKSNQQGAAAKIAAHQTREGKLTSHGKCNAAPGDGGIVQEQPARRRPRTTGARWNAKNTRVS
jgi:hypothetical protein